MPPKGSKHVPYKWTPEAERLILLTALKNVEFQPNRAFYTEVTQNIGGGVTIDAVRYCLPDYQDPQPGLGLTLIYKNNFFLRMFWPLALLRILFALTIQTLADHLSTPTASVSTSSRKSPKP